MAEALALLSLYLDWGVDTLLDETPHDRFTAPPESARHTPPAAHHPEDRRTPSRPEPRHAPQRVQSGTQPDRSATAAPDTAARIAAAQTLAASCTTLDALSDALSAFDGCALRQTATNTLLPRGPHNAPVMVIGETPEAEEDRSGQVMAGPAGEIGRRMFQTIGLGLEDIAYAPVVPWRPPGGRPPSDIELRICLPFLSRTIALLAPRRIVLLGSTPTRLLLGDTTQIARLRGRWQSLSHGPGQPAIPALVMRHPAQFAASSAARRDGWSDLLMLRAELDKEMP